MESEENEQKLEAMRQRLEELGENYFKDYIFKSEEEG